MPRNTGGPVRPPRKITDHLAKPGPGYWEWRCLRCDGMVSDHVSFWRFQWERFKAIMNKRGVL